MVRSRSRSETSTIPGCLPSPSMSGWRPISLRKLSRYSASAWTTMTRGNSAPERRRRSAPFPRTAESWHPRKRREGCAGSPRRPPQRCPHMNGMPEGRGASAGRRPRSLRGAASSRASSDRAAGRGRSLPTPGPPSRGPTPRRLGPPNPRPPAQGPGPGISACGSATGWPCGSSSSTLASLFSRTTRWISSCARGVRATMKSTKRALSSNRCPTISSSIVCVEMAFRLPASRTPMRASCPLFQFAGEVLLRPPRLRRRPSPPSKRISRTTVARRAGQASGSRMRRGTGAGIETSRAVQPC